MGYKCGKFNYWPVAIRSAFATGHAYLEAGRYDKVLSHRY